MRIVVVSPVRAVADAVCRALRELLGEDVRSDVARYPRDILTLSYEASIVLVDANVITHATWLDLKPPIRSGTRLVFFGFGAGVRDLCFCRSWNADGLVGEGATLDEIAQAASEVTLGRAFIAPSAAHLLHIAASAGGRKTKSAFLTKREQEVANLVSFGSSNFSIATHLGISVETARIHVKHILRKLDAATREDIAERYSSFIAAEYQSSGVTP